MIYLIGTDGEKAISSEVTKKQIEEVKKLTCALAHKGQPLDWDSFDNPDEPRTLFQAIMHDRKQRVDEGHLMADRPNFAVVTAYQGRAVRLEYYEGHDALQLVYDIRAPELQGKDLPKYMEADPCAYDPVDFLEQCFGIPPELSQPLLEAVHKMENEDATNQTQGSDKK
jgi:hypothetical protein